ncbi:MAG: hypothetical protein EXR28_17540 [Betaproteobacteria bacterium]|nr:hypothetical protein [Betaproteobacteria bacterium]
MTTRREILIAWGALATLPSLATLPALAQQPSRVRRIAYFSNASAQTMAPLLTAFRQGMAELRWVDGRDYVIEDRYSNGNAQAVAGLLGEMFASQPDLLLAPGDEIVRQYLQRTKTLPIVFTIGQDPVGSGLVASLKRPGGNPFKLMDVGESFVHDGFRRDRINTCISRLKFTFGA